MVQKKVNQLKKQRLPSHFESRFFDLSGRLNPLSRIAALNPLVWYSPANLTSSTFWKNDGSLGEEYNLDALHNGGGVIVESPVIGTAYRTSDASYVRAALGTSPGPSIIDVPYTVGVIYNIAGQGQEFNWLYGSSTAGTYAYVRKSTNTDVCVPGLGSMSSVSTGSFYNTPQYQITEFTATESAIKGKYSNRVVASTATIGTGSQEGFRLGSPHNYSSTGVSQELEVAAVFIVPGAVMGEVEAAILADFPQLAGTPASIPDPIIDYDARNLKIADAGTVGAWTNVGTAGSAWDLEQLTGANQPTYIEGTYPSVKFAATDYLRMPASSSAVTWTKFKFGLVVRTTATNSQVIAQWNADAPTVFRNSVIQFGTNVTVIGNGTNTAGIEEAPYATDTWYSIAVDLTDFANPMASVNGSEPVTLDSISPGNTPNRIALGDGFPHAWDWIDGEIGRMVFYNTNEDIQNISKVLSTEWGIAHATSSITPLPQPFLDYDVRNLNLTEGDSIESFPNAGTAGSRWDLEEEDTGTPQHPTYIENGGAAGYTGGYGAPAMYFSPGATANLRMTGSVGTDAWDVRWLGIVYRPTESAKEAKVMQWTDTGVSLQNGLNSRGTRSQSISGGSGLSREATNTENWVSIVYDFTDVAHVMVSVNGGTAVDIGSIAATPDPDEMIIGIDHQRFSGSSWGLLRGRIGRMLMYKEDPGVTIETVSQTLKEQWNVT